MKILFLTHSFYPAVGGIESISEILSTLFYDLGHEIRIATQTQEEGVKEFPFPILRKPTLIQLIKQMAWADLIFENNPCVRMSWPNSLIRKPIVTGLQTWIGGANTKLGFANQIKRRWVTSSDALIACSQAIKDQISSKAIVIDNPYDDTVFFRMPGIDKNLDFVFLGRLVSDKGAKLAIQAFDSYRKKDGCSNSILTIIGDGEEKLNLLDDVDRLGLRKYVNFAGKLRGNELVQLLNQHCILLVPSMWDEPFGIVVLEGMACGCIPIVSDGGGLPDAVGRAGLIFKKGEVNSLVEKMVKLKNDENLRKDLRSAATSHLENHQLRIIAEKYLSVFETVINS